MHAQDRPWPTTSRLARPNRQSFSTRNSSIGIFAKRDRCKTLSHLTVFRQPSAFQWRRVGSLTARSTARLINFGYRA